jgi:hypothetical protein
LQGNIGAAGPNEWMGELAGVARVIASGWRGREEGNKKNGLVFQPAESFDNFLIWGIHRSKCPHGK